MRLAAGVLSAFALLMFGASQAQATLVSATVNTASSDRVNINDNDNLPDRLTLTLRDNAGAHEAVVTDAARALTPGLNCVQGANVRQVVCTHPAAGGKFTTASVSLNGGDDQFTAATVDEFGVAVFGGDGRDQITGSATKIGRASCRERV